MDDKIVAGWWDLGDKLLVKYNHFGFYNSEKRTRDRVNAYARPVEQGRPHGRHLARAGSGARRAPLTAGSPPTAGTRYNADAADPKE